MKPPKLHKETIKHLSKVYKEKPEIYDTLAKYEDCENNILKTIFKEINFKGKSVLELGGGTGRFSISVSRKVSKLFVLDKSEPMLKVLKKKFREKKIKNIKILKSGFSRIPLPKESVDIIFSIWSFPAHSTNMEKDLKEIRRVLKKDGKIILVDVYHGGEYNTIKKKVNPKIFERGDKFIKALNRWLKSKGFKHKTIDIIVDFKTKKNIDKICTQFFGQEISIYLLVKGETSFKMKVSIFYGGK